MAGPDYAPPFGTDPVEPTELPPHPPQVPGGVPPAPEPAPDEGDGS